jgi:hypothetical protein
MALLTSGVVVKVPGLSRIGYPARQSSKRLADSHGEQTAGWATFWRAYGACPESQKSWMSTKPFEISENGKGKLARLKVAAR